MYRSVLCLVCGLIVGMQLTDFVDFFMLHNADDMKQSTRFAESSDATAKLPETTLADWLYNETRVLCVVLTLPQQHETKAAKVKSTWGKRCNKLIFISSLDDEQLGAVNLNISEGRTHLFEKVRAALSYIYERHSNEYDWFLKADDDTYVIMENLRRFLYSYDSESPVYFGCKFWPLVTQGYMSGGAGYVLSRDALRRFNLFAKNNTKFCQTHGTAEDEQVGRCLQNVGVVAGDSRDVQGRERFLPLAPRHLMAGIYRSTWFEQFLYYKSNESSCCSNTAISFHYAKAFDFAIYEFFLYRLHVHGVQHAQQWLPPRLTSREMQKQLELWSTGSSDNIVGSTLRQVHDIDN